MHRPGTMILQFWKRILKIHESWSLWTRCVIMILCRHWSLGYNVRHIHLLKDLNFFGIDALKLSELFKALYAISWWTYAQCRVESNNTWNKSRVSTVQSLAITILPLHY